MKTQAIVVAALVVALSLSAAAGPIAWSGAQNIAMGIGGASGNEFPSIHSTYLDLDGNGDNDFFVDCSTEFTWFRESGENDWYGQFVESGGDLFSFPVPTSYGTDIEDPPAEDHVWVEDRTHVTLANWNYGAHGQWIGVQNGYLGVRFDTDGNTHYGWVRMSVSGATGAGATIHDWAWNTTPGQGLWAGQVPEPSTWILFGLGGAVMIATIRRRRRQ